MKAITPLRRKRLVSSIAAVNMSLAAAGMPALAQQADDGRVLEEIIVTGYAGSLSRALDLKRESAGLVDSILAEDIADFPDLNLAESLQRIPGVAITRDAGEGREISVRGLNSTFTRVQINGMQAQSLAAGSGGVQTNRGFDFNVFASELFNRIDVHKTTSAELEEGSLGATVSLVTGRPLDYDPQTVVMNLQGGYNDQSGKYDPRASGLFSFSNEEETIGGLLSVAYSERYIENTGAESGRWETDAFGSCSACANEAEADRIANAWHPRIPRNADKTHDQERLGLTGSFQWRPSERTLLTVDALYAKIESERAEPFMHPISLARTGSTGVAQTDVAGFTIDQNNTIIAAEMDGVDTRVENFFAAWESEFNQFSLNFEHAFSDRLRMNILAGASESQLDNRETTVIFEHYSENDDRRLLDYAESNDTVFYDYTNMRSPVISQGWDTTDPANWEFSEFRDRLFDAESTSETYRFDVEYDLNEALLLKAGVTYKEYGYDLKGTRADRAFSSADELDGEADGVACGISFEVTEGMGRVTTTGGQRLFMPDLGLADDLAGSGCWPQAVRAGDTRSVDEESLGYFVQLDFDTDVFGRRFRGNLGVRQVETDLSSTGINSDIQVTVKHDYRDTLPAINLAYELTDQVVLRASWAEVMSRPNLSDLNPGGSVAIFGDPRVSYGNPFLEPFSADALDLSVEWYFAESSVLSLAYFRKEIDSFPDSRTDIIPWRETGLPDSLLGAQIDDLIDADFEVTRRVNGSGGDLDGWELQYQQPLTFLPGPDWVRNFGVIANYTKVDSEVFYGEERKGPLTGQSDDSYNATLYWENDVFSARISLAHRGEYFSNLSSSEVEKWRVVDATDHVDLSASYKINDNFRVTFEAINITDESTYETMDPAVNRVIAESITGAQYYLGVTYRM